MKRFAVLFLAAAIFASANAGQKPDIVPIMLEWSPPPMSLWPDCVVGWKIYECPVLGGICVVLAKVTRCEATLQLDGTVSHLFFCTAFCKGAESSPSNFVLWSPP